MRTLSLMIPPLMAAGTFFLTGCDSRQAAAPPGTRVEESSPSRGQPQSAKAKQADFLNRIRAADPQGRTIDRALLNEQNELGLVLDRSVELDKIPALMRAMLTKMAAEFPGEDLTILTYTPSNPPRKIGTARLNARTRDMTYTAEQ
ncbi:MAG: hypothetical protein JWM59_56 [Verrucomicrobiales bacterium]|nr:hypothetical protein [Verrucomicrobiales bacterium]